MAAHGWRSHRALGTQLFEEFGGFDYYQLIRLSRRLLAHAPNDAARARPADSDDAEAALDARLDVRADLSAAFAGFEVSGLERDPYRNTVTLRSPNYCIAGAAAPLPAPYTEWLRTLVRDGQRAMADFFDLFNRRVHLWRWRIKSRLHPGLHNRDPEHSDFADYLGAIIGLADPGLVRELPARLPRRALLGLTGLLADGRRSGAALTQALGVLLGAEVTLTPLVGRWLPIDPDQRNALGLGNSRLGEDLIVGRRWHDPQAAIELHVAPMPRERICALLPGGCDHDVLRDLLRLLTERRVDVWMNFRITDPDEARLPTAAESHPCAPRLGYTAVLGAGGQRRPVPPAGAAGDAGNGRALRFLVPAFDNDGGAA